ncbi:MAG TPA: hypothetical protein VHB99_06700 [Pirellulales bacterium]|nr:hypothetical protein [Pirellulales bacterium]
MKVVLHTKSLRSRTPVSVEYEFAGRVVYYLLIRWLIVQAAESHAIEPLRISFTNAVRELEAMRPTLIMRIAATARNRPHRRSALALTPSGKATNDNDKLSAIGTSPDGGVEALPILIVKTD